jgi:hypothetical protein
MRGNSVQQEQRGAQRRSRSSFFNLVDHAGAQA